MTVSARPIESSDETAWRKLWRGYLEFYETTLDDEIYRTSFARLIDPAVTDYHGLLALRDDAPVGLVHYIFHRHGWQIEEVCYLQDRYVAPEARGTGAATLIFASMMPAVASALMYIWLVQ